VDVYRNGAKVATTMNDGAYTDTTGTKGPGTYIYQVCAAGTLTCSKQFDGGVLSPLIVTSLEETRSAPRTKPERQHVQSVVLQLEPTAHHVLHTSANLRAQVLTLFVPWTGSHLTVMPALPSVAP
jgi:hypothetical protein